MEKYEEIKQDLYVKEVGKLATLYDASKMLGVSNKQLRKFVIEEQIRNNNLLVDMINGVFKYKILPQDQLDSYISLLVQKNNLEYAGAVIDNVHPNLKKNPLQFIHALATYNRLQLKELDDIKKLSNEDNILFDYVSQFASDYGISSKRLYSFLLEMKKKNTTIFEKMSNLYKMSHADEKDNKSEKIKKVPNLEYLVAALIYNFPGLVTTSDGFFDAITSNSNKDVEKADNEEIDDARIQRFLNAKKEYLFSGPTK